jgi:hypothetical protein
MLVTLLEYIPLKRLVQLLLTSLSVTLIMAPVASQTVVSPTATPTASVTPDGQLTPAASVSASPSEGAPTPYQVCRNQLVEAYAIWVSTTSSSDLPTNAAQVAAMDAKHEADRSVQQLMDSRDHVFENKIDAGKDAIDNVIIADCLVRSYHLPEARKLLVDTYHRTGYQEAAHQLALVEEQMHMHAAAVAHITRACSQCEYDTLPADYSLNAASIKDFRRIAASKVHAVQLISQHQSETEWDQLTGDERQEVKAYGGTRDNGKGYPDRIETYDASRYHQEIWWYTCESMSSGCGGAYTFLNGRLQSEYHP